MTTGDCGEKIRLLEEYEKATHYFSMAVHALSTVPKGGFTTALAASEAARQECESRRRELSDHRAEHGC